MKFFFDDDPDGCFDTDDTSWRKQPNKNWQWGHVYLLDSGDHRTFKIGRTKYLIQRLEQLRETPVIMPKQSPLSYLVTCEISTNCAYVEELLHMRFDDYHVKGEWFEFGTEYPALIECIEAMEALSECKPQFYDTWFDYFCTPEVDIAGWIKHYATKDYLFRLKREVPIEMGNDDEHLLGLYENSSADPKTNGGQNKFLRWQANQ